MICEVRNNEVILKHPTFLDLIAIVRIMVNKDLEIAFNEPGERKQ